MEPGNSDSARSPGYSYESKSVPALFPSLTDKRSLPTSAFDWQPYDPSWLVAIAAREARHLVSALRKCTKYARESDAYYHFVDSTAPNQPGSEWQFEASKMLESSSEGLLVLDVLKDGRIGGIEFLDRIRTR